MPPGNSRADATRPTIRAGWIPSSATGPFANSKKITRQLPVLPDSDPVSQYVQRLGAKLGEHAPGYKWPYNFHVVNVKDINAFALPGGPVFVNLGTVQAADNEAQLAGVMAHELSHVVQRHGTRGLDRADRPRS